MDTRTLERFARGARRTLREQVTAQLERVTRSEGAARAARAAAIAELEAVLHLTPALSGGARQNLIAESAEDAEKRREKAEKGEGHLTPALSKGEGDKREGASPRGVVRAEMRESGVEARPTRAGERQALIERVAYTWFNRFCALRYMDANEMLTPRVVSPAAGETQPQILQQAKAGSFEPWVREDVRRRVLDLLSGKLPSGDAQQEAYRLLVVAACNHLHTAMPFLFEKIDDYTELLMPADLLSSGSILAELRTALPAEACTDVEVIGWLYQFYIAEKKEEVDAKVKAGGKVEAEELPAKTSLYTPHWIVRYLVENSLGRLWLQSHPGSRLAEQMAYYIAPEEASVQSSVSSVQSGGDTVHGSRLTDHVSSPEEITILDPACGSGHMLTYAFDLLYAIYLEEGYERAQIARLILEKNLFGLEIDERAADLAAFALVMKAAKVDARFLRRSAVPEPHIEHIHALHAVGEEPRWLQQMRLRPDEGAAREALLLDLGQWQDASHVGSLLRPRLTLEQIALLRARTEAGGDLFAGEYSEVVSDLLRQVEPLARRYDVVVANPPYLGGSHSDEIKDFAKEDYPRTKSDLFAMFMERGIELVRDNGLNAMVTMESWMFLSSYESMRESILDNFTILDLLHMPYLGKGSTPMGINFGTVATVIQKAHHADYRGDYGCVRYYECDDEMVPLEFPVKNERLARASAADFKKIPGSPIAYWFSDAMKGVFTAGQPLGKIASPRQGLATGENDRFVRIWYEVTVAQTSFTSKSRADALHSRRRWFPYNKGGDYRKWYGNQTFVVNWENDGGEIRSFTGGNGRIASRPQNMDYFFRESISWSKVTSGGFSLRFFPPGFIFDVAGCSIFGTQHDASLRIMGTMNSPIMAKAIGGLAPTLNYEVGQIAGFPIIEFGDRTSAELAANTSSRLIDLSRADWDAYETSWDFTTLPLLGEEFRGARLETTYRNLRAHWQTQTLEMQRLEEENNRIFINAYGLQEELSPEVALEEITLTCNPQYRYGGGKSEADYEKLQRADTVRELLSYAVGCAFGRYALEKPGLILANQGETLEDWLRIVGAPAPRFVPDRDNVLPILDGDWFPDDIVGRCKEFLRVTFGEAHFGENLAFVEAALGKELRAYFVRDFYTDHVRRYQKRPIYWLFSSPGGVFNALVYMHRYRADTASVVLNGYLRPFRQKLVGELALQESIAGSGVAAQAEKTRAQKQATQLARSLREIDEYERDVLFPLAAQRIEIDLDDGVKVNYAKFGKALRGIK